MYGEKAMKGNIKEKRYIFLTSSEYGSKLKLDRKRIKGMESSTDGTKVIYDDGTEFLVRETEDYIKEYL